MSARAPEEQKTTRSTSYTRESARSKRTRGEDVAPSPGHTTNNLPRDYRQINGWGADLDPKNRPSYPKELPSDVMTVRGEVKHWQEPPHRIHMSNEQPNLTPVFGTTCPPKLLSGKLRDYAYQYGEGTNRHWMTLMLADRIDMVESMIVDAIKGKPDNFIRERGYTPSRRQEYMLWGAAALGALTIAAVIADRRSR